MNVEHCFFGTAIRIPSVTTHTENPKKNALLHFITSLLSVKPFHSLLTLSTLELLSPAFATLTKKGREYIPLYGKTIVPILERRQHRLYFAPGNFHWFDRLSCPA
jgi:hypothetical protein